MFSHGIFRIKILNHSLLYICLKLLSQPQSVSLHIESISIDSSYLHIQEFSSHIAAISTYRCYQIIQVSTYRRYIHISASSQNKGVSPQIGVISTHRSYFHIQVLFHYICVISTCRCYVHTSALYPNIGDIYWCYLHI